MSGNRLRIILPALLVLLLPRTAAAQDRIHLRNGEVLEGEVIGKKDGKYRILLEIGTIGIPEKNVARIERGPSAQERYRGRAARVDPEDAEALRDLARWCLARGLQKEALEEYARLLRVKPQDEEAHRALGHTFWQGEWLTEEQCREAGLVQHKEGWVSPERALLLGRVPGWKRWNARSWTRQFERWQKKPERAPDPDQLRAWLEDHEAALKYHFTGRIDVIVQYIRRSYMKRRSEALSVIQNPDRYPSRDPSLGLQTRVSELVRQVDEMAEGPLAWYMASEEVGASWRLFAALREAEPPDIPWWGEFVESVGAWCDGLRELITVERTTAHPDCRPYAPDNETVRKKNEAERKGFSEAEWGLWTQVNDYRARMGLRRLRLDKRLCRAALAHAEEMKRLGYFDHRSPVSENRDLEKRLDKVGYRGSIIGENIAHLTDEAEAVLRAWRLSPGHHRNLLREDFRRGGIAKVEELWVLDLGD